MQFLVEEAAATALELHEAELAEQQADTPAGGESDVRARHKALIRQLAEQEQA